MTDSEFNRVLAAAQAGEAWACTRLYEDLRTPVMAWVRLRGTPDPDDVVSETFLQVFRDLRGFTGDEASFRSWVFTIAHRRQVDDWRRRSRRVVEQVLHPGADAVAGDVEDEAIAALGGDRVARILGRLTRAQRDVVLLRIVADLSLEEVATITGRRVNAVKSLQHRALSALRRQLDDAPVSRDDPPTITGTR